MRTLLLSLALTLAASCIPDAHAQSIGGGGGGASNGGTYTTGITFSGVTTDIQTPANEDLTLKAGGSGKVTVVPYGGNGTAAINLEALAAGGSARIFGYTSTIGGIYFPNAGTDGIRVGAGYDLSATDTSASLGQNMTLSTWSPGMVLYGENTIRIVPENAMTISNPTDTSSTPLGSGTTGAGTACRMSAGGAAAWTPSETGAVDGMFWCCTNTGSNVITMTESSGVYEGPATASAVGQWDTVCFEYVTDRFVERSFTNN